MAIDSPNAPSLFIEVEGPADANFTLITYDVPYAPNDPKKSIKYRQNLGLKVEERTVDPNVRIVIDSFITPRRWKDASGTVWVQHASPYPTSRIDTVHLHESLREKLQRCGAAETVGICADASLLVAECFLEVIRQVTVECWERGLLLLRIHAERVAAQSAHRELFESRVGYAFRLALKGEKDTSNVQKEINNLRNRIAELEEEERVLREKCDAFAEQAEEERLIAEKQFNDEVTTLRKEGIVKKKQLEHMIAPPSAS